MADSLGTFRYQLGWAALYTIGIAASLKLHHSTIWVLIWPLLAVLVCLLPMIMWRWDLHARRVRAGTDAQSEELLRPDGLEQVRRLAGRRIHAGALSTAGDTAADGVAS